MQQTGARGEGMRARSGAGRSGRTGGLRAAPLPCDAPSRGRIPGKDACDGDVGRLLAGASIGFYGARGSSGAAGR